MSPLLIIYNRLGVKHRHKTININIVGVWLTLSRIFAIIFGMDAMSLFQILLIRPLASSESCPGPKKRDRSL